MLELMELYPEAKVVLVRWDAGHVVEQCSCPDEADGTALAWNFNDPYPRADIYPVVCEGI